MDFNQKNTIYAGKSNLHSVIQIMFKQRFIKSNYCA